MLRRMTTFTKEGIAGVLSGSLITIVGCALLVRAEADPSRQNVPFFKTLASTGFVTIAASSFWAGHLYQIEDNDYALWVLVAQVASFAGDVLLLGRQQKHFLAGLVSFLVAHLAYTRAFFAVGVDTTAALTALAVLVPAFWAVWQYLRRHLPSDMVVPVVAYMTVISAMVAASFGAATTLEGPRASLIPLGAFLFYLSDLGVARQKFVTQSYANQVIGLPLYYLAQLLLVRSTLYND